ncbi:hypothetical protein ACLBWS_12045 [Brucellaceae bacterium D45D]
MIVEAFGDVVLPQIPEAIGRAILRTEAALNILLAAHPFGVSAADHDIYGDGGVS